MRNKIPNSPKIFFRIKLPIDDVNILLMNLFPRSEKFLEWNESISYTYFLIELNNILCLYSFLFAVFLDL